MGDLGIATIEQYESQLGVELTTRQRRRIEDSLESSMDTLKLPQAVDVEFDLKARKYSESPTFPAFLLDLAFRL